MTAQNTALTADQSPELQQATAIMVDALKAIHREMLYASKARRKQIAGDFAGEVAQWARDLQNEAAQRYNVVSLGKYRQGDTPRAMDQRRQEIYRAASILRDIAEMAQREMRAGRP